MLHIKQNFFFERMILDEKLYLSSSFVFCTQNKEIHSSLHSMMNIFVDIKEAEELRYGKCF